MHSLRFNRLRTLLLGGHGTIRVDKLLDGLTLQTATTAVPELPYTIYALLWHVEFCQATLLRGVMGEPVVWPPSDEQWPLELAPDQEALDDLLSALRAGLYEASELAGDGRLDPRTGELSAEAGADLEQLMDLAVHNAYHWGQVAVLRRLLDGWPGGAAPA